MFDDFRLDLMRCGDTKVKRFREFVFNPGMWAIASYRFRRAIFNLKAPRIIRIPLNIISVIVQLITEITTNIQIPPSSEIGAGAYIPHTGYIVIASTAKIGKNCTICQGVTVGHGGGGKNTAEGTPVIGDRVYIGPGAIIIGSISIGQDALIGAGSVVIRDIPDRGVAVGNPSRIISKNGSFELIRYEGMESDINRMRSLGDK